MMNPIGWDESCSLLGKPAWGERSVYDDDYDDDEAELSPLDDDYVREGYEDADL